MTSTDILLDRALCLIMDEWGKTREEALAWLNDDTAEWTPRPQTTCPSEIDGKPAFIQVSRVSEVCLPPRTLKNTKWSMEIVGRPEAEPQKSA